MNTKKMIVYGTNHKTEFLKRYLNISYIIDNDSEKWGKTHLGIPVFNPRQLMMEIPSEILVVLAFRPSGDAYQMVANGLKDMGFIDKVHFVSMYDILPKGVPYEEIRPFSDYAPWKTDGDFDSTYSMIRNYTLVDKYRAFGLWSLIEQVSHLQGALMEVGVWKGGTGALIAKKSNLCGITDTVYLCDTFTGVVKTDPNFDTFYKGGEHKDTSDGTVRQLIDVQFQLKNVKILKGIFPDETHKQFTDERIRFCHIDVDSYASAKDIFEWIWPKMVAGGVVVFDDYGFMCCDGITKYVNELKNREDAFFIYSIAHGIIVKMK